MPTFSAVARALIAAVGMSSHVDVKLCPQAEAEHAASKRQFCHIGHTKIRHTICYARSADNLGVNWQVGLVLHELGHLALRDVGIEHTEEEANFIGGAMLSIPVAFKGPLMLEWSPVPKWLREALHGRR